MVCRMFDLLVVLLLRLMGILRGVLTRLFIMISGLLFFLFFRLIILLSYYHVIGLRLEGHLDLNFYMSSLGTLILWMLYGSLGLIRCLVIR